MGTPLGEEDGGRRLAVLVHGELVRAGLDDVVAAHRTQHEADSGPWNTEWMAFRERTRGRATKPMHFEQASRMIQRFDIFGLTMTYWQGIDLTPQPRPVP
ncbi:DUF2380 domain-containing protein [Corallococcus terminator]|uniref:DUF2380 domain-containing protein n=1 Tax=Corallococcus terminator TaxID=2316733 RepID=A0A3A8HYR0_9BACT|nr:DUF2380 domain-containing protein [Corallococcus terminator]